jgi:hypothetical protein
MAFCPGCGYEFRDGLTRCPDCDVDLVADLDEVDSVPGRRLRGGNTVSVFTATREQVEMVSEMLDQEGIPSMIRPAEAAPLAELHVLEKHADTHGDLIGELIAQIAGGDTQPQPA